MAAKREVQGPASTWEANSRNRSFKAVVSPVDYDGRINLRGDRANVRQQQNTAHPRYTGKNLRTPKRHIVSGKPADLGNSPSYAPGAFTRGMGHSENSGYTLPDVPCEIAPQFDLSTCDGLRAARDDALSRARAAESRGNRVAADNARSNARDYRNSLRVMERQGNS